jgi:hypothetical protein
MSALDAVNEQRSVVGRLENAGSENKMRGRAEWELNERKQRGAGVVPGEG